MARKSNKTSHVLNLITNGAPAEPESKETETLGTEAASGGGGSAGNAGAARDISKAASTQETGAVQTPSGDSKVIVVDASESDKIADAIRERLEEQIEQEEKNTETSTPDVAVTASVPMENGTIDADALMDAVDSMMPEAVDMMTKAEAKAEAAGAAAETEQEAAGTTEAGQADQGLKDAAAGAGTAAGEAAPASDDEDGDPGQRQYHMVNVMEEVIRRYDLSGQIAKYGVCTCSRCHADVQALTLTHLPSKYVVVDGNPIAPIIGYYESKYRSRLLTEVMKACILVKDKPRHNRATVSPELMDS